MENHPPTVQFQTDPRAGSLRDFRAQRAKQSLYIRPTNVSADRVGEERSQGAGVL